MSSEEPRCKDCHKFTEACPCFDWDFYIDQVLITSICIDRGELTQACWNLGIMHQKLKQGKEQNVFKPRSV